MAHELGVFHGGFRLENVLLDEQGNAHLTDFGIAADAGASIATDIEGLATLAVQLLAGARGTISELVTSVDPSIAGVISAATDRLGYSSVGDFVDAFRSGSGVETALPEPRIEATNPYKGLATI